MLFSTPTSTFLPLLPSFASLLGCIRGHVLILSSFVRLFRTVGIVRYVLGMLGAVVSALLIFSEPNLSFFGKASSAFLIAITINTGMLTPFAELAQVGWIAYACVSFFVCAKKCMRCDLMMSSEKFCIIYSAYKARGCHVDDASQCIYVCVCVH